MDMTTVMPYVEVKVLPIEERRWLGMNITPEESWAVYVTTRTDWQVSHPHAFEVPDEHGDTSCTGCGACAWSLTWIAPGLKCTAQCVTPHVGENKCDTGAWVRAQFDRLDDLVDRTAQYLLERELGAVCIDGPGVIPQVVLAELDPSQPARRSGIPIPSMELGRLD